MFNLTINAVPASTIIVGRRATWLDRHAAEELRDYVKKISGTILNIADETLTMAVTGNRILIGRPSTSDLVKNFADQTPGILPAESDTENDCLAIVQRAMRAMGGEATAESIEPHGLRVILTLRVTGQKAAENSTREASA